MTDAIPQPHELWAVAEAEHTDPDARRATYLDLMRYWGHVIPKNDLTPEVRQRHNHMTRNIHQPGSCPACDRYHRRPGGLLDD